MNCPFCGHPCGEHTYGAEIPYGNVNSDEAASIWCNGDGGCCPCDHEARRFPAGWIPVPTPKHGSHKLT